MADKHSKIAPSSAGVWVKCPGSVAMKEQCPERPRETNAHEEGHAAHWAAAERLSGRVTTPSELKGATDPEGFIITDEILDHVEIYARDVFSHAFNPLVEKTVRAPRIHAESWGSVDCSHYDQEAGILYVWDFKYGWGLVEVFENWQLINYAIGLIDQITGGNGLADQHLTVSMRVVQPRPYHRDGSVREWRVKASDLRAHANLLHMAAEKALSPNPTVTSGDHCRYCSARIACPTAYKAAMNAVDYTEQANIDKLSPEVMADTLHVLYQAQRAIKYLVTGIEAEAIATIKEGKAIPGWGIDPGMGRLEWAHPIKEVLTLGIMVGVDLRTAPEAITPTQAKAAGVDKALVDSYSKRGKAAIKLVPSDNTVASRVFGKK